jgi:hypothetical protein
MAKKSKIRDTLEGLKDFMAGKIKLRRWTINTETGKRKLSMVSIEDLRARPNAEIGKIIRQDLAEEYRSGREIEREIYEDWKYANLPGTPNAETRKVIAEVKAGKGKRFASKKEMLRYLNGRGK